MCTCANLQEIYLIFFSERRIRTFAKMFYFVQIVCTRFSMNYREAIQSDIIFSSPELKAKMSFSDHLSSVVCLSVRPSVCLSTFHIFIFFSRTTGPISTKLGTKYPWVKGIQVCSNERPRPSQRGDNRELKKINWQLLKNLLLQNHWAYFNQFWHKVSLGEWNSCLFKWRATPFSKGR